MVNATSKAIYAFRHDGTPDLALGGGVVRTRPVRGIVIGPNGGLVAFGTEGMQRMAANGAAVPSFQNGMQGLNVTAAVQASDDSLFAVGARMDPQLDWGPSFLTHVLASGALESCLGDGGLVALPADPNDENVFDDVLQMQRRDHTLTLLMRHNMVGYPSFYVARYGY